MRREAVRWCCLDGEVFDGMAREAACCRTE
jgi:hypothetical protein